MPIPRPSVGSFLSQFLPLSPFSSLALFLPKPLTLLTSRTLSPQNCSRIQAFRASKLSELNDVQQDKVVIERELQATLAGVAESRHAAHLALTSIKNDAAFIKKILGKCV